MKEKKLMLKNKYLVKREVDELSREDQLEQEVAELKDKQIRLFAEFENLKKEPLKSVLIYLEMQV